MAGLFLIRTDDSGFADPALAEARAQFARHHFQGGVEIALPGWRLLHYPYVSGGPDCLYRDGEDLVAIAGTFAFDGKMGRTALAGFLAAFEPGKLDWSRVGGQFTAVVAKAGRAFLFGDFFTAHQAFHDTGERVFSTSLLAAAKALPRLGFDAQGVYEYAFNVVPIGNDTVFAELKLLGPERMVELVPGGTRSYPLAKPLPVEATREPVEERVERHRTRLAALADTYVATFGDRVNAPLSGGMDSRLLLAMLRAAGCRPNLYVYGDPGDPDIAIAQAIGAAEGFDVTWVDKARPGFTPDRFPAQVESDFHQFDALPAYGNIFDDGGNTEAFDARHAGGALAASGGCGEVYRDFFFLPARPLTAARIAETFFARYAASDATERFDPRSFLARIAAKIDGAIQPHPASRRLPRTAIEQVYPRIRCRALFGREISIESRFGAYAMPFLDQGVAAEAMTLPIGLKQAGAFEAMLITAIDPALARHPSAYGHDFASGPDRRHRFNEWSTRIRPGWLRRHSYALRRRLGPVGDEHGGLVQPEFMGRVIDLEFPAMRRFFRMERVADSGLWRRIAALEYLAAHLGGRLAG